MATQQPSASLFVQIPKDVTLAYTPHFEQAQGDYVDAVLISGQYANTKVEIARWHYGREAQMCDTIVMCMEVTGFSSEFTKKHRITGLRHPAMNYAFHYGIIKEVVSKNQVLAEVFQFGWNIKPDVMAHIQRLEKEGISHVTAVLPLRALKRSTDETIEVAQRGTQRLINKSICIATCSLGSNGLVINAAFTEAYQKYRGWIQD